MCISGGLITWSNTGLTIYDGIYLRMYDRRGLRWRTHCEHDLDIYRASGNINERTQAIYDSIDPPNELRNRIHLRNLALVHVALITSLMQRVAGSTVTNDRQHGARGGMYGAHEYYVQPYPVTNS